MADFNTREEGDFLFITWPAMVDDKIAESIEAESKNWLLSAADFIIFEFNQVREISSKAFRPLTLFNQTLKSNRKKVGTIGVKPQVKKLIIDNGLQKVFNVHASLDEFKEKNGLAKKKTALSANFINPFIVAANKVFETQVTIKLENKKPYVSEAGDLPRIDIAGILSLTSKEFNGSISICFSKEVFLKVYGKMLGEEISEINDDVKDCAGELLNIIFGQAKTILNDEMGYSFEKSIPTILAGEKLSLHYHSQKPAMVIPFGSEVGDFFLEILID